MYVKGFWFVLVSCVYLFWYSGVDKKFLIRKDDSMFFGKIYLKLEF